VFCPKTNSLCSYC